MTLAVVYFLLATAILILLTFSSTPQKGQAHLSLNRRFGNRDTHAPFDPLVRQLERLMQEGGSRNQIFDQNSKFPSSWESNPFSDVLEDPEEYFSETGQLNLTGRLQILFPLLDRSPKDGTVSLKELEAWNVKQAIEQLIYRTQREMREHDKDGDESITLKEYLPQFSDENIDSNDIEHGQARRWKEQFVNADVDGNGFLNFTEFNDLLHPEESDNERIQIWLLKEKIQGMDNDKDGKLNFVEFRDRAYDTYRNYYEFESGGDDVPNAEEKFAELDVNTDKFLSERELRPIIHHLYPGELSYARYYTKYLIHEADDDRDGKLTLNEMLDHPHVFYSTVVKENEFDDEDDFHDEFR